MTTPHQLFHNEASQVERREVLRQDEDYSLPVIIKRDRRHKDGRPHEAVETEALRQTILIEILRKRLDDLLPELLPRVLEREARQRRRMVALFQSNQVRP